MSLSALHCAPLAGASNFFTSLYAGSTAHCALGHAAAILGEGESTYVEAKAPLRFSDKGGGGIKRAPAVRMNNLDRSDPPEASLKSRIEEIVLSLVDKLVVQAEDDIDSEVAYLLTDKMPAPVRNDIDRAIASLADDIERMWKMMTKDGGTEELTLERYIEHNIADWMLNKILQFAYVRYKRAMEEGKMKWRNKKNKKPCRKSSFFSKFNQKAAEYIFTGTGRRFMKIEKGGLWEGTKVVFESRETEITIVTPSCWLELEGIDGLHSPWKVERADDGED